MKRSKLKTAFMYTVAAAMCTITISGILSSCKKDDTNNNNKNNSDEAAAFRAKFCNVWWKIDSLDLDGPGQFIPPPQFIKFCYPGDSTLTRDDPGSPGAHTDDWKYIDPTHFIAIDSTRKQAHATISTLTSNTLIYTVVWDSVTIKGYFSR